MAVQDVGIYSGALGDFDGLPDVFQQALIQPGGGKWERVFYYRKPRRQENGEPCVEAGWITWGDSQTEKRQLLLQRGFQPLVQLNGVEIKDSQHPWKPLLSHPTGPALLPVDQIRMLRLYNVYELRRQWPGIPEQYVRDPEVGPALLFPQLRGHPIEEYQCPTCARPGFPEARQLFHHLNVWHSWEAKAILDYGEASGIDFSRALAPKGKRVFKFDVPADAIEELPDVEPMRLAQHGGAAVAYKPKPKATRQRRPGQLADRPRDSKGHLLPKGSSLAVAPISTTDEELASV